MNASFAREEKMYRLWEELALPGVSFTCGTGERIVVVSRGHRNLAAGPDFLDAVLLVDGSLRIGAVEMHLSERDWFQHRHNDDPAYAGVILHVLEALPERARLSIPTVGIGTLRTMAVTGQVEAGTPVVGSISEELLVELSWSRLLRRTLEVIRGPEGSSGRAGARRVFVRRLFDGLGYSRNRNQMATVASRILAVESSLPADSFDETIARLLDASTLPAPVFLDAGRGFMSEGRLCSIEARLSGRFEQVYWYQGTRQSNTPVRRIWGASKLLFDLYHRQSFDRCLELLRASRSVSKVEQQLVVRLGSESFVGVERARDLVVNALLPVALAQAVAESDLQMIESVLVAYRSAPPLASNRIEREVRRRYAGGLQLDGAFWQQGAIEYYQRYLSPDRSGLSFVAEASRVRGTAIVSCPV